MSTIPKPNNLIFYAKGNLNQSGTLQDFSGQGNHGTLVSAPPQVETPYGSALDFDGSADCVTIDDIVTDLASTTTGTFSALFKTDDNTTTQEIISFGDTDADTRIQFDLLATGLFRGLAAETGTTQWAIDTDNVVINNGIWVHLALVQNGTEPILYVNGKRVAQTFSTSTDKTYWFNDLAGLDNGRIGCGNWNSGGNATWADGRIPHAIIWDTNLTDNKISELYNYLNRLTAKRL